MKFKIHIVLPVVLAIVLPGISFYSNLGIMAPAGGSPELGWVMASVFLFLLWHVLWRMWEQPTRTRKALYIIAVVLAVIVMNHQATTYMVSPENVATWPLWLRLVFSLILFLAIQYALRAQEHVSQLRLEKEQIQTENYRAQLQALRAQIDPHFLFNSLNTLRSMVRQQHPHSEDFVMSLSDFYRQTLKHNDSPVLPLSDELAVLNSYLFLMKSRNEKAVQAEVNISASVMDKQIPSMALQIIVENCFKHNSMSSRMSLKIWITNRGEDTIEVKNNLQPRLGDQESSGYGLDLLRKRYELMNVDQGIHIEQTADSFIVQLKLI